MTARHKPLLLGPDVAANELDCLSGRFRDQIEGFSLASIKAIVERVYDASEQLQPLIEVKP